jgi:hypothetical protein
MALIPTSPRSSSSSAPSACSGQQCEQVGSVAFDTNYEAMLEASL